jgi:hypothetical protein
VDISPIPGERVKNPAEKVGISRQPLDLGSWLAHCVGSSGNRSSTGSRRRTRKGSQGSFRGPIPAAGNEEGPRGLTGEPAVRRGDGKGRKVRLRPQIELPRRRAERPASDGWWGSRFPARLSGGRTGVLDESASDRCSLQGRPTRLSASGARAFRARGPEKLGRFRSSGYSGLRRVSTRVGGSELTRRGLRDVGLNDDER